MSFVGAARGIFYEGKEGECFTAVRGPLPDLLSIHAISAPTIGGISEILPILGSGQSKNTLPRNPRVAVTWKRLAASAPLSNNLFISR